jgi:hypothetical protein
MMVSAGSKIRIGAKGCRGLGRQLVNTLTAISLMTHLIPRQIISPPGRELEQPLAER